MKPVVLLSRSAEDNARTAADLAAALLQGHDLPSTILTLATRRRVLLVHEASDVSALAAAIAGADAVACTSRAALDAANELGLRERLAAATLAVVGDATADHARRHGLEPTLVAGRPTAAGLAESLVQRWRDAGPRTVVWLCGDRALPDLADALRAAGHHVEQRAIYGSEDVALPATTPVVDVTVFHAPSAADRIFAAYPALLQRPAVALGETTAAALRRHGVRVVHVAEEPTTAALADAVAAAWRESR